MAAYGTSMDGMRRATDKEVQGHKARDSQRTGAVKVAGHADARYNGVYTISKASYGFPCFFKDEQHLLMHDVKNDCWRFGAPGMCGGSVKFHTTLDEGHAVSFCESPSGDVPMGKNSWNGRELTVSQEPHPDNVANRLCCGIEGYVAASDLGELESALLFVKQMTDTLSKLPKRHGIDDMLAESQKPPFLDVAVAAADGKPGCLTVPQWYDHIQQTTEGATPALMDVHEPQKDFKMAAAPDGKGPMRWAHPDHGFEFALDQTLSRLPEQCFDKADWEPMITAVLAQAKDIRRVWDHDLGFGALNSLCEKVLSSGAQPEFPRGLCIESMQHFFKESMKLQKDMKKCEAAVKEELKKVQVITDRQEEVAKLDDLSADIRYATVDDDEKVKMQAELRELLPGQGFADDYELGTEEGLLEACNDFQGSILTFTNKADADLLEARKALMKVLHKTLVSVEKRMETMVKLIPVVEERAEQISTDTTELVASFVDKSAKARTTLEVSKQKAAEMQNGIDQQLERREESRAQHETGRKPRTARDGHEGHW